MSEDDVDPHAIGVSYVTTKCYIPFPQSSAIVQISTRELVGLQYEQRFLIVEKSSL